MNEDRQWKALVQLRRNMSKRFSDGELRDLCFDLQVEYEDLPGAGRSDKVRELLSYLARRGRISQLLAVGGELRPDLPWPKVELFASQKEGAHARLVGQLQERQAELLGDLYAQIVDVAEDLRNWAYQDMPIGLSPAEIDEGDIIVQVRELGQLASKARIYLGVETRQQLESVLDELVTVKRELERRNIAPDEETSWEAHVGALDGLFDKIPPAIVQLEDEIRRVLGVG